MKNVVKLASSHVWVKAWQETPATFHLSRRFAEREDLMTFRKRAMQAIAAAAVLAFAHGPAMAAEVVYPSFMWGESHNIPLLNEMVAAFEAANPGDTVKDINVPIAAFWDKQFTEVTSGKPADILTLFDGEMAQYLAADLLEPLNPWLDAAGIPTDSLLPTHSLATRDGKLYGLAMQVNSRALIYNKKLLDEAGLQPPSNLDEFYNILTTLRDPVKQQFGYATWSNPGAANVMYIETSPLVTGFGGGYFKDGKPNVTSPETVAALEFYKKIYDEGLIPRGVPHSTYRSLFIEGKVAMYASGAFMLGAAEQQNPETFRNLETRSLPFPGNRSFTLSAFLGIPKGAPNKDAAGRFLAAMLQPNVQAKVTEIVKALPARSGMVPAAFAKANPWFAAFEEAALTSGSYAPEGAEQYASEIYDIINGHIENMLFNDVAAAVVAKELQAELESLMASKT